MPSITQLLDPVAASLARSIARSLLRAMLNPPGSQWIRSRSRCGALREPAIRSASQLFPEPEFPMMRVLTRFMSDAVRSWSKGTSRRKPGDRARIRFRGYSPRFGRRISIRTIAGGRSRKPARGRVPNSKQQFLALVAAGLVCRQAGKHVEIPRATANHSESAQKTLSTKAATPEHALRPLIADEHGGL